ncbi:SAM-dependent methyltransferase [Helicobacter valdiviensis]|uniref:SAM-dependent methyltransferase n=1 Tax=Helicobacter valdiviensis TaxID=1458358 RepID=A0A2W6PLD5_9HELI|nr:methyltransferase [Helicobacter valdiviensis]PZT47463.1 SAM-dependent methyltransferase [Helicobacter valdiviensis]
MQIYQPKDGYCYNSDTLFLYDFCTRFLKPRRKVLEVGSGSGVLGLLCARDFEIALTMIEKNPKMAELSLVNSKVNKIQTDVILGDFLELDIKEGEFDVVFSNPPFYYEGVIKSKNYDIFCARYEENLPFEAFLKKVYKVLKPQGEFIFCYDSKQFHKVFGMLYACKMRPLCVRFVHPSNLKDSTLFLCRVKKNSKSQTQILPPLFTHINGEFSKEVQEIYKKGGTYSIKC